MIACDFISEAGRSREKTEYYGQVISEYCYQKHCQHDVTNNMIPFKLRTGRYRACVLVKTRLLNILFCVWKLSKLNKMCVCGGGGLRLGGNLAN